MMTPTSTSNTTPLSPSAPKKIGINGWFLQFPFTGIGQYTIQLLKEFSNSPEFLVVVPSEACVELMRQENITLPTKVIPALTFGGASPISASRGIEASGIGKSIQKHFWEQYQMPKFFMEEAFHDEATGFAGAEMVWLPYPCVKWFVWHPCSLYKTVVTVHDTIPYTMKDYWHGPLSALAHAITRWSIRRAERIITVSETSAKDIVEVCQVPREKIQIIHNGVSETFFHPADSALTENILNRYGLTRDGFFLYVGGYDPRKRTEELVASYANFAASMPQGKAPSLVLVGQAPAHLLQTPGVVSTGFLEEKELNALYDTCRAFVHFSAAEGFNIPFAQALIKGVTCGVSDIEVHHEIGGSTHNVTYLDSKNPQSLLDFWLHAAKKTHIPETTSAHDTSTRDPSLVNTTFSWKTSAESHLKIFHLTN